MKNGSLPASATSLDIDEYQGTVNCPVNKPLTGLTKREHFAGLAMQGLLANSGGVIQASNMSGTAWCNSSAQSMAKLSIECADALLKELEK